MSICGTGMGNGALLMRSIGHEVTGADQNTYPPMSDRLQEAGVEILEGYDAKRLEALSPDLVVVGNVNTRGNPEVEWLLDSRAIPFVSLPELLAREILQHRHAIVVAGTHGKTTTTTLTAALLHGAGIDAGYLIGGVPNDLPAGAHAGALQCPFCHRGG
jgi:UDP-N-acetylmuramate: L-alanyl-gamma-D-glutamyl-meso-diaminopimelate ligase